MEIRREDNQPSFWTDRQWAFVIWQKVVVMYFSDLYVPIAEYSEAIAKGDKMNIVQWNN